jgi:hypothetical protein
MKYIHLLLLPLLFAACTSQKEPAPLSVSIGAGQMPALARDANNNIHLVYGIGDSIMYASSADGGTTFIAPVLVDTLPGFVDFATRGPQIATTKNAVTIIAVNQQGDIFSYSKDESGKWLKAGRVNDADTTNKEGFLGLSGDGNNNLFAIWPDLRDNNRNKIYGARSTDGGQTWNKNALLYASPDSTVCECCRPSVVMNDNHVYVMFRNFLHGNRDLYLIQSDNAGATFGTAQKLGKGNWQLDGCPMDGGGIAIANNGAAQTVWRRENKIYSCEPGALEKEIAEGKNCTIETVNNKNIYAFTDNGNIYCLLPGAEKQLLGKGSMPVLKSVSNNQVICIWQNDNQIYRSLLQL